jgi:fluoride ion exporter CrcB/FEX
MQSDQSNQGSAPHDSQDSLGGHGGMSSRNNVETSESTLRLIMSDETSAMDNYRLANLAEEYTGGGSTSLAYIDEEMLIPERRVSLTESRLSVNSLLQRRSVEEELHLLDVQTLHDLPEEFHEKAFPVVHRKWATVLTIVHGSIWGVVARKGLNELTGYGGYLGGVVWSNFAACIIMGMLLNSERFWVNLGDVKGAIPLYAGFTTGFCGTFSSFSSMIIESFTEAVKTRGYPNSGYGVMEFFSVIIGQIAISSTGFQIGGHIIEQFDDFIPEISLKHYQIVELFLIVAGIVLFIVDVILIGVLPSSRSWTFAILFAPFGALSRFYMSKFLNQLFEYFPLGTFAANSLGSLLLAVFTLLGQGRRSLSDVPIASTVISCRVLVGLDDGFCGALTTVSTFIVELHTLKTAKAYFYGVTSIVVSFGLVVVTLGSYNWTHGLTNLVC